jgi:hypothetical protein
MRACVRQRFTAGDGDGEAMSRLWFELSGGATGSQAIKCHEG